jgi:DnaJ-class molecular chaperone
MTPDEAYEDFDPFNDEDDLWVMCPDCGGTGLTIESFDCAYCDGTGEIEI